MRGEIDFDRDQLDPEPRRHRPNGRDVRLAVVVVMRDQREALAFQLLHGELRERRADGALGAAECAEHVARRRDHRGITGRVQHHMRYLLARHEFLGGDRGGGARAAMHHEDVVDRDELLHHRDDIVRAALVVLDQDLDLSPVDAALLVDFLVPHPGGLQRVETERGQLTGHRREQADGDLAVGDARVGGLRMFRSGPPSRRRAADGECPTGVSWFPPRAVLVDCGFKPSDRLHSVKPRAPRRSAVSPRMDVRGQARA